MIPVLIVGAGLAGIACARRLTQAGVQPILIDKGRGIGGRVATRKAEGLQFDHGAQYVSATEAEFGAVLRDLEAAGWAAAWPQDGPTERGRIRYVGTPGMASLAKGLAVGLDVRHGVAVTAIQAGEDGWAVSAGEACYVAARVVVTVPAPQVMGLLGADDPLVALVVGVRMDPCLTLMAAIASNAPFVARASPDEPLAWIAQDCAKPGRPERVAAARAGTGPVTWVAHASPAFSALHLEEEPAALAARMAPMLCQQLGVTGDAVIHAAVHRWRYAQVAVPLGQPFLRSGDGSLYLGGDWCLGPRVEAAWMSGTAIADDLLAHMS